MIIVCKNNHPQHPCPRALNPRLPMNVLEEYETHVLYLCPVCQNARIISKSVCGGTMGAGRKADGRHTAFATGMRFDDTEG